MSDTIQIDDLARFLINEFGNIVKVDDMSDDLVFFYSMKVMNAQRAELARLQRIEKVAAEEVDEFNAGYQAFEADLDVDNAESMYRNTLPEGVPYHDVFRIGYAWAKYQRALAAALKELEGMGE